MTSLKSTFIALSLQLSDQVIVGTAGISLPQATVSSIGFAGSAVGAVTSGSMIKLAEIVELLPHASVAVHVTAVVLAVHTSRAVGV